MKFHHYQKIWIVAYIDTERNLLMPCYDCGLHRTQEEAEKQMNKHHDPDGCRTKVVMLGDYDK